MTPRRRKTKRARQAQARRLYRRLNVRLMAQYQEVLVALGDKDMRHHLSRAVAFSHTLGRIARVEHLSGVAWNWDHMFSALARRRNA